MRGSGILLSLLVLSLSAAYTPQAFASSIITELQGPKLCRIWLTSPLEIENALRDALTATASRLLAIENLSEAAALTTQALGQKKIATELNENQADPIVIGAGAQGEITVSLRPEIAEKLVELSSPERADFSIVRRQSQLPRELSRIWLEALAQSPLASPRVDGALWENTARPLEWRALFDGAAAPTQSEIARALWPRVSKLHEEAEYGPLSRALASATPNAGSQTLSTSLEIQIALLQGNYRELFAQLGLAAHLWTSARKPSHIEHARGEYLRVYYAFSRALSNEPLIAPAKTIP